MADYNVQDESKRILEEHLLGEVELPQIIKDAAQKVKFIGGDTQPFIPTPCKLTESASALTGLLAASASAVAADRYGIDLQDIEVNTDSATLFIMSVMLPTVNEESVFKNEHMLQEFAKGDLYQANKPIHQEVTNVYQTKDGKWYHLHGSMNAGPVMKMVGAEEQDVSREDAIKIYMDKVAQWDAETIERTSNDEYKQAGTVCNTPEEFLATEHGKIISAEPLWNTIPLEAPQSSWPAADPSGYKPLANIKVIDFSRVIAAPVASKLLALLGADVLKVTSSKLPDFGFLWPDLSTGKRDADVNMKSEEGKKIFTELVKHADVLIDGYRPGALQRLGFDSESLRKINPNLIYLRENCYGFKGPLAHRSGWQQISDCLTGVSWLQGKFLGLDEPVVPLLPNSDYQTGIIGAISILQALLLRTKSPKTYDINISLTQYNLWYLHRLQPYTSAQQEALKLRNEGFSVRHYDEMQTLLYATLAQVKKIRPEIFTDSANWTTISGREWGLGEASEIEILAPPFEMEWSVLGYAEPSGSRGRSKPVFLA